jgi:hypothetical protein
VLRKQAAAESNAGMIMTLQLEIARIKQYASNSVCKKHFAAVTWCFHEVRIVRSCRSVYKNS